MPQKPKSNPRSKYGSRRKAMRKRVLAYYDTCYLCGKPVDKTIKTPDPLSPEVDEIVPVSRGGSPTDWNNVRLTHRQCNQLKKAHTAAWAQARIYEKEHGLDTGVAPEACCDAYKQRNKHSNW